MRVLATLTVVLLLSLIGLVGWRDPWAVALNGEAWLWIAGPLMLIGGGLVRLGVRRWQARQTAKIAVARKDSAEPQ